MKKIYAAFLYCSMLGMIFACTNQEPKDKKQENADISILDNPLAGAPVIETNAENLLLVVSTEKALLKAEPNLNSPLIIQKQKGDTLRFANRVSEKTFAMRLEGIDYDEPWLKVFLEKDAQGFEKTAWIYGGNVNFINLYDEQLQELILDRRIRSVFGEDFVRQYQVYKARTRHISNDIAFELAWRTCEEFTENLELRLTDIVHQQRKNTDTIADFYWLNQLLEGSAYLHWYKPHDKYYIWKDLRFWQEKSLLSSEENDDAFVAIQLKLYEPDSIEFFQPQTSLLIEGKKYCTLGDGIYEKIFMYIGAQLENDSIFTTYYKTLVKDLLSEIVYNNYYWRALPTVTKELKDIIKYAPSQLFSRSELLILENRLKELSNPEKYAIYSNILESGI